VRFRFHPWQLVALIVALCIAAVTGLYLYRARGGSQPLDLVSYLPTDNATVVYIDVEAMRRTGVLNLFAGSKAAEELEYQKFVDDTRFDYRQDLDAVAAAFKDGQVFIVARGRFHWGNLMEHVARQGGGCHNGYCVVDASRPHRRISFYALKSNLLGMAVSKDDSAAYQVTRNSGRLALLPPGEPVWMVAPSSALNDVENLPAGTRPYASALRNAEQIVFAAGPRRDQLMLFLNVSCKDQDSASSLLVELENTTNTLRKWIAREHAAPNPGDLSGVLTAGSFHRDGQVVHGEWPLPKPFIESLAGSSY
jgi:hypothetical protein